MGLLSEGHPLSWAETQKYVEHVRTHGISQFISLYHKLKDRQGDVLKWGDEVEYIIVDLDSKNKSAKVSLKAEEYLKELEESSSAHWAPEYGSYMIEGTPGHPYGGGLISEFNRVEDNMRQRRETLEFLLSPNERILTMSTFPRLGCPSFTKPVYAPNPKTSFTGSIFWPDEAIFLGHPRFKTLSSNIKERRGKKVAINVPVYKDTKTNLSLQDPLESSSASPDHVYMDAMGFGMGLSCLQVTFQACNLSEAEILYDQLASLCPIFLALTASSPIFRGYLTEVDVRWSVISASVDCRTEEEMKYISKSRYASISSYLSEASLSYNYNDIDLVYDETIYQKLRNHGIKDLMAKHVSHLFIRDTVSLFSEKIHQNDETDTDHFENIQSTNWQTMRFKPPPPTSEIGWRVEFRPCELQFTDFENAAIVCFIVLLTRAILSFNYNFLIPISLVDENMKRAETRDAIRTQKFYFRRNLNGSLGEAPMIEELSIDEILNGVSHNGLLSLVEDYLRNLDVDADTLCTLSNYWEFLRQRASGTLMTNARYMREFVLSHHKYEKNSFVSEEINYDLIVNIDKIVKGEIEAESLIGQFKSKSKNN